jgi:hypothetical protein
VADVLRIKRLRWVQRPSPKNEKRAESLKAGGGFSTESTKATRWTTATKETTAYYDGQNEAVGCAGAEVGGVWRRSGR